MRASLHGRASIDVFIEAKELVALGSESIEGPIASPRLPHSPGVLRIERGKINRYEPIGSLEEGTFHGLLLITPEFHRTVIERGQAGYLQKDKEGERIFFRDISRMDPHGFFAYKYLQHDFNLDF